MLRSGCYLTHDDNAFSRSSPFGRVSLTSALHAWAQVVSRSEPTLALLNAGRHDVPYDSALPVRHRALGCSAAESAEVLSDAEFRMLNDQHAFLSLSPASDFAIGDVVRLGVSHPCTAFDKWTVIPVLDNASAEMPTAESVNLFEAPSFGF